MRPLEWLLCITMLPAILLLLLDSWMGRQPRAAFGAMGFLLVAVLLSHAIFEGLHWQLGPAYLAAMVLVVYVAVGRHLSSWAAGSMAVGCIVLIAATAYASYLIPMFQLPKPSGKYAIGTRILYVVDPTRRDDGAGPGNTSFTGKRELVAQAWYPAQRPNVFAWSRFGWYRRASYRRLKETNLKSSYQSVLKTHAYLNAPVDPVGAPFPVLLFSPAWTGQRTQSTFLMEELASHGFMVVSVDHTYYSGLVELPGGRVYDASRAPSIGVFAGSTVEEQNARGDKYTRIEAEDQIAVLNDLERMNREAGDPFSGRLDMERVGALGHSIGGAAAAQACLMDARIKAALDLDGWLFADVFYHGLAKPFMRIIGTPEIRPTPQELASSEPLKMYWQRNDLDDAAVFSMLRRHGGYGLAINGLNHSSFTDRPLYTRMGHLGNQQDLSTARAYQIVDAYVLAFFSHSLRATDEPLLRENPSFYPEVSIQVWP